MVDETAKTARLMKVVDVMVAELERGRHRDAGRSRIRPDAFGQGGHQGSGRRCDRPRPPPQSMMGTA